MLILGRFCPYQLEIAMNRPAMIFSAPLIYIAALSGCSDKDAVTANAEGNASAIGNMSPANGTGGDNGLVGGGAGMTGGAAGDPGMGTASTMGAPGQSTGSASTATGAGTRGTGANTGGAGSSAE